MKIEIDDRELRKLEAKIAEAEMATVRIGVLGDRGGNEQHPSGEFTMVELAIVHEFGSPKNGIPERSFIRRTFKVKADAVGRIAAKLAKMIIDDKMSVDQALELLGQWGAAEVKKTVTEGAHIPPPLKDATVERKGSTRPLVDTGRLIQSVTYMVEKGASA